MPITPPEAADRRTNNQTNWQTPASHAVTLVLLLLVLTTVLRACLSKTPWMLYLEDDFFYYLKVAQNLAHGAGSTFNGIVPTNGYHPLWLLILTAFSVVTTKPAAIFGLVATMIVLSTLTTYLLSRRLLQSLGPLTSSALAMFVALYSMHLFYGGMEVILTIPLVLAVVLVAQNTAWWQCGTLHSAVLGLLISAMVLSRLDTALLAGLFLCGLLLHPQLRRTIRAKHIAGLTLGITPIIAYVISNRIFFHTWLPVSGLAKQLKFNHEPTAAAWRSLFSKSPLQLANILPIILALILLPHLYRRLTHAQQVLYPIVLIFPFLYLFILCCLSDWPLWSWYYYPLRTALCVGFLMLGLWPPTATLLRSPIVTALILLVVFAEAFTARWPAPPVPGVYAAAEDLQAFAATHHGVYAMGDRSGMVGYLLPDPVIQTEGLVMDRNFITYIQHQTPLLTTLANYNVRYYVATAQAPYTGCFHAAEPYQAGPASPHMQADLCQPPIATYQHEQYTTLVFDLQQPAPTPAN